MYPDQLKIVITNSVAGIYRKASKAAQFFLAVTPQSLAPRGQRVINLPEFFSSPYLPGCVMFIVAGGAGSPLGFFTKKD